MNKSKLSFKLTRKTIYDFDNGKKIVEEQRERFSKKIEKLFDYPKKLISTDINEVLGMLKKNNISYDDIVNEINRFKEEEKIKSNLSKAIIYADITYLGNKIPISSGDIPTACITFGGGLPKITVGYNILKRGVMPTAGAIIHEVAHYKYTYPLLKEIDEELEKHVEKSKDSKIFHKEISKNIRAVVEDIYIEEIDRYLKGLANPLWEINKSEYGFIGELGEIKNISNSEIVIKNSINSLSKDYENYVSQIQSILQEYYKKILYYNEYQKARGLDIKTEKEIEENFKKTIKTMVDMYVNGSNNEINKLSKFFNLVLFAGKITTYKMEDQNDYNGYKETYKDLLTKYVEINFDKDLIKRYKENADLFINASAQYIKSGKFRKASMISKNIEGMTKAIEIIFSKELADSKNAEKMLEELTKQAKNMYGDLMSDPDKLKELIENSNNIKKGKGSDGGEGGGISVTINTSSCKKQDLGEPHNGSDPSVSISINDFSNPPKEGPPDISNPFGIPNPYQSEVGDNKLSKQNQNKQIQDESNGDKTKDEINKKMYDGESTNEGEDELDNNKYENNSSKSVLTDKNYKGVLNKSGDGQIEIGEDIENFKRFNQYKNQMSKMISELINIIKLARIEKDRAKIRGGLLSGKSISSRSLYRIASDYKIFQSKLAYVQKPIQYINITYDVSGSVDSWLEELHKSHVMFSEAMRKLNINTSFVIFSGGQEGTVLKSVSETPSIKKDIKVLSELIPGGGTKIMGGIKTALEDMIKNKPRDEKAIMFIITDGCDDYSSEKEISDTFLLAKLNNIKIIGINVFNLDSGLNNIEGFNRIFKNDYIVASEENFLKELKNKIIELLK